MKLALFSCVSLLAAVGCSSSTSTPGNETPAAAARTARNVPRACPASDFPRFLQAFSADETVRNAYTAPSVKVTDWIDVDETELGTSVQLVSRDQYRDFRLRYRDGTYLHVEQDDGATPVRVDPKITPQGSAYRVEYTFNMSEGNSWVFSRVGDCWQLTADPDPSLL